MDDKDEMSKNGFAIINNLYSAQEIDKLIQAIDAAATNKETFRKSADLFAIRQFLTEVPAAIPVIFNQQLKKLLGTFFGPNYFAVKGIYFDKPPASNWYVAYHQDLTISVDRKLDLDGFSNWTVKQNQFAVQPPLRVLQNVLTIRIHLDDTDENNGALKVIPASHLKGIYRPTTIENTLEKEAVCTVPAGDVMLMKPLLMHSSGRTTNNKQRRVIHIEFSSVDLPAELKWSEKLICN